jgi:hypothetical protein
VAIGITQWNPQARRAVLVSGRAGMDRVFQGFSVFLRVLRALCVLRVESGFASLGAGLGIARRNMFLRRVAPGRLQGE